MITVINDDLVNELKKCPKSFAKLKQYTLDNLMNFQQMSSKMSNTPQTEVPDLSKLLTDDIVINLTKVNVRSLYDFFDNNNIFVSVHKLDASSNIFYRINNNVVSDDSFSTRLEAEVQAFVYALNNLESKL